MYIAIFNDVRLPGFGALIGLILAGGILSRVLAHVTPDATWAALDERDVADRDRSAQTDDE